MALQTVKVWLQITDAPKVLTIVATPTPASLPLSYDSTELTLPLCGSGVDFEKADKKMNWKATNVFNVFAFVDLAGVIALYQRAGGVVWVSGTSREVGGAIGVVEAYRH